jgi:flagella basal body P-ring formation protein FlgA
VTAEVAYYDVVAVSARPLRNGDPLTPDAVRFERRDVTRIQERAFSRPEDLKGLRVRTALPAGRILDRRVTEAVPLVRRGDAVTIRAQIGAVSVTTSGRALSDGAAGESVTVENADRQKIQGRVDGPGMVKVAL